MNPASPVHVQDRETWNRLLVDLPGAHLLQSWEWGQFKERYGWMAERLAWHGGGEVVAAAQVLRRTISLPFIGLRSTVLYCPKGPCLDWAQESTRTCLLSDLQTLARKHRAVFLKIDPQVPLGYGMDETPRDEPRADAVLTALKGAGWRPSPEQVQFRNTLTLDLSRSEDEILAGMKQKTRYNLRLASRRGVRVRLGDLQDLDLLYRMYAETSLRDGFVIRKSEYYHHAWGAFVEDGLAQPFVAEVEGEAVAGLFVFHFGKTAWYLYGMSRDVHREKMPNHLLQWEAIRWAKGQGCAVYDFWGAPDRFDPEDPMWGVFRFKLGFGAEVVRSIGAWDLPVRPLRYRLYMSSTPIALALLRARGRAQTRATLE